MTGSTASASAERVLVCGLNWIGDSIMAFPALQAYRARHPDRSIDALVKPGLAGLWAMHPDVDELIELDPGLGGARRAAAVIRGRGYVAAYVLPHSFRSALAPFLGRVGRRVGMPGHGRDWMLTDVVPPPTDPTRTHQQYEYLNLLGLPLEPAPPAPRVKVPGEAAAEAAAWMPEGRWVGLLPGAARGPSKQWPVEHFTALGKRLVEEAGVRLAVMGAPGERETCEAIAAAAGPAACSLAGKTRLASWAAALARCAVVVANDSGGMHLAAAMGTPVVAIYGTTDPTKTGPLGRATILQHSRQRDRRISRESAEARFHLASIQPDEVYEAVSTWIPDEPQLDNPPL